MTDVEPPSPTHAPKREHSREHSLSSISSSTGHNESKLEVDPAPAPVPQNPPKKKGGRKPIYATSEERKQRNRQAQAAFRERRTEYIKQLEATIKKQDETLQALHQRERANTEECINLRYRNSLLERILLEKGVDVQAELKKKELPLTGKLTAGLPNYPLPPQLISTGRRPQVSRPGHKGSFSKVATTGAPSQGLSANISQPTSPISNKSPTFASASPLDASVPSLFRQRPQSLQINPQSSPGLPDLTTPDSLIRLQSLSFHPQSQPVTPIAQRPGQWAQPFQTHLEHLEQECDAPADLMEDDQDESTPGPDSFLNPFRRHDPGLARFSGDRHSRNMMQSPDVHGQVMGGMGQVFEPFDPSAENDPFGFTASMQFPTQFSFEESSLRK